MNSSKELYVFLFWSKSFINLSCVRYLYLLKLIWTVSSWAKSCDCPYHVGMWALPVPLSPANLLAVFRNNRKLKSVSLSFCLSDSDYSLLTGVGSLSGRQANVSIISMDLLWDFDTQPPSSTPKPCSISLSLSWALSCFPSPIGPCRLRLISQAFSHSVQLDPLDSAL